jgi:hypothetical protein
MWSISQTIPFRSVHTANGPMRREAAMRLLSELRVPFDHIGSHLPLTGAAFGFGVAYLLFALMFLTMIAEIFLVALRAVIWPARLSEFFGFPCRDEKWPRRGGTLIFMDDSFPKFYAVGPDDVVVRIDSDGKEVRGTVMLTGVPYPPVKALIEGGEISESEAMRLVNEARAGK